MTDGVARVLHRHGTHETSDARRAHLTSTDPSTLWTGGMFLTERAGARTSAPTDGCQETPAARGGSRDTSVLLERRRAGGARHGARERGGNARSRTFLLETRENAGVTIERLKEKLGVRSMATGEVTLTNARAEEVGGFAAMAEMLNLSRLYNAVASVGVIGRAVYEARHYIERRHAFGRPVIEWPLAQQTFFDLEAEQVAATLLTFETVDVLTRADAGDADAARLLRILTPIAKAVTKVAVPWSPGMELSAERYIEDSPMPRLLRDASASDLGGDDEHPHA